MILPIYVYGQPVLKKVGEEVGPDYKGLQELISDMWETMYNAKGVGLAAPQVGKPIRLFIVDTMQLENEESDHSGIKRVFINARRIEELGDLWEYEEGCLSIPDIRGDVERPESIRLRYVDEQFQEVEELFEGLNARVIQHEYDHIDGVLFTEHLKPLRKRRIRRKLENMKKGIAEADYPVKVVRSR